MPALVRQHGQNDAGQRHDGRKPRRRRPVALPDEQHDHDAPAGQEDQFREEELYQG